MTKKSGLVYIGWDIHMAKSLTSDSDRTAENPADRVPTAVPTVYMQYLIY